MIMSLVALGIAGIITYLWLIRGFFSALLHLVCVVVAGAIAFALWEPASYFLLSKSPRSGFFAFIAGSSFALGLIIPFALSLAVLRVMMDKAIPSNAQADKVPDMIGGGICGLGSGIITAGIITIGGGTMWLKQDFWGSQRLEWNTSNSSLSRKNPMFVPFDDMVAAFYGRLSTSAFEPKVENALARQYPYLADVPSAMRRSMEKGKGRNFVKREDVSLASAYTVGVDDSGAPVSGFDVNDALKSRGEISNQDVFDRFGKKLNVDGAYIAGYVFAFREGARERQSSQVNVTTAQVRLLCSRNGEEFTEYFPVAMISRADISDIRYERYRPDESGLGSVQGDASPAMAFEFVVPPGFRPEAIYLKGVRFDVRNTQPKRYMSRHQRQAAIDSGSLMGSGRATLREERAITVDFGSEPRSRGIVASEALPQRTVLQDGTFSGLQTTSDRRIASGEQAFNKSDMEKVHLDRMLRVEKFAVSPGVHFIQLQVTESTEVTPAVNIGEPPIAETTRDKPVYLVDTQGNLYACIGYVYKDNSQGRIRYTRDRPLQGLADLPGLPSRTQRNRQIWLLFEVTRGVDVAGFAIGDELLVRFQTPLSFEN